MATELREVRQILELLATSGLPFGLPMWRARSEALHAIELLNAYEQNIRQAMENATIDAVLDEIVSTQVHKGV